MSILGVLVLSSPALATDPLFAAIVQVESGGDPDAIGDHGLAHGLAQAHRGAWTDGCKALKVKWDYLAGVKDYEKSRAVFWAYTTKYGARTDADRARAWHFGPTWREKSKTDDRYWRKVQHERAR